MPIIIKKKQAEPAREPAPLVVPAQTEQVLKAPSPTEPSTQALTKSRVMICKLCGHGYIAPCHGENPKCMNRAWALGKKKAHADAEA